MTNPIRAGMAEDLPSSAHASIAARLAQLQGQDFVPVLAPHMPQPAQNLPSLLPEPALAALLEVALMPFGLEECIKLVDTIGRAAHPRKRGAIPPATPPLLARLGMNAEAFIASADHFFKDFAGAVGTPTKLIELSAQRQHRIKSTTKIDSSPTTKGAGSYAFR